jgi:uridine kinase
MMNAAGNTSGSIFLNSFMADEISILVSAIIDKFKAHQLPGTFTVAISGIDAAGKGYVSKQLNNELRKKGYRVALVNIDPWQNPIPIRLQRENAAENIYENIFRWNDFFGQLIFPLQKDKSIYLETKGIRSDADIYYPLVYDLKNIDILLIEGILLLKKKFLVYYDYKVWINCSFETGLKRALKRNIEKLDDERLLSDYHTFYYPAQRYHFAKDDPQGNTDFIFHNDEYHVNTHS